MSAQAWIPAAPSTETFADRLRFLRWSLDMSVEAIAKKCDIPAPTWRTWEKGARPHGMDRIVLSIHRATEVDRDWLMWGSPTPGGVRSETAWNVDADEDDLALVA